MPERRALVTIDRRRLVKLSSQAGLAIAFLGCRSAVGPDGTPAHHLDEAQVGPWIRIGTDERVTIAIPRAEMGQGINTSLAMLVTEELGAEWSRVRTEWAPVEPAYGRQSTGASESIHTCWNPLRQVGAVAREMLERAAAEHWGVAPDTCQAAAGMIAHRPSGRTLSFGSLAARASRLPIPEQARLKTTEQHELIGRAMPSLELEAMATGRIVYSSDVSVDGMLVSVIQRCPHVGGALTALDDRRAQAMPGVTHIFPLAYHYYDPSWPHLNAVAVVGRSFYEVEQARQALEITWDPLGSDSLSSASIMQGFERSCQEADGEPVLERGDVDTAMAGASRVVSAAYRLPHMAHAPMETMCCVAHFKGTCCEIWTSTQNPHRVQQKVAASTGINETDVLLHRQILGGGFGRRLFADYAAEAALVSRAVSRPVKLYWSREDDIRHGFYRPAAYNEVRAGLDAAGRPICWDHKISAAGTDTELVTGIDAIPYGIPHKRVRLVRANVPVPTGAWRSVARSLHTFVAESFMDELAHHGGHDPLELRLALLHDSPRYVRLVETAAEKAGWGRPRAEGATQGLALCEHIGSIATEIVEVSVDSSRRPRVHRVVCTADCGIVVNPQAIQAQIEGAVAFGLSSTLLGKITFSRGRVEQRNLHDYPILRIDEMPPVEAHLIESTQDPTGVGELAVPAVAPAIANALFTATGRRARELPIHEV